MGHDRKKEIESIVPYNISFSGDNKKNIFLGGLLFVFIFFLGGRGEYYICYLICFLIKAAVFNLLGIWKLFTIKWLLAYLHVYLYFFIFYLIFNYVYIDDFLYIYIFMHCVLIFFKKNIILAMCLCVLFTLSVGSWHIILLVNIYRWFWDFAYQSVVVGLCLSKNSVTWW